MPALLGEITARHRQVRVQAAEARQAIETVTGMTAVRAIARLRFGPGRTCEAVARVIETAAERAEHGGLAPASLVVTGGQAIPAEDVVRVRRKFHGKADWISSPTTDVAVELRPEGLHASMPGTPPGPESAAEASPGPASEPARPPAAAREAGPLAALITERLFDVLDPDLGINVVDLGFVRRVALDQAGQAVITMTLTSAACPVTGVMEDQIRASLLAGDPPLVPSLRIEWQWTPAWRPADITPEGRDQLRAIGFTI
jgi:metal-sulfur cluster biosynthetic enzyme/ribosomal protein L22